MSQILKAEDIVKTLRQARDELHGMGILHARLFGSMARGDNSLQSDIDLAVTLNPEARISGFDLVGIERHIASLLQRKVDLVKYPVRGENLQQEIERDGVLAF